MSGTNKGIAALNTVDRGSSCVPIALTNLQAKILANIVFGTTSRMALFHPQKFCVFTFHVLNQFSLGLFDLLSSESSPKILLPSNVANKSETCSTFCSIKNRRTTLIHAISSLLLRLVLSRSYRCSGKTTTGSYRITSP